MNATFAVELPHLHLRPGPRMAAGTTTRLRLQTLGTAAFPGLGLRVDMLTTKSQGGEQV
jgi:hypothetical protein